MRMSSFISCTLVCCAISSCGTPRGDENRRKQAIEALHHQKYDAVAGVVDKLYGGTVGVAPKKEKHKLLWNMQMGMLQWMQHDFIHTEQFLGEASRLVDERRGISVGGAIGAAIGNETARAYAGEAYEHTQVAYIRMLNLLEQAQIAEGVYTPAYALTQVTAEQMGSGFNPGVSSPNTMDATVDAAQYYEQARNMAMGMTQNQLQETEDAAGKRRYRDDGYARMMAAVSVMAMPNPENDDRQFADAMFSTVTKAFKAEQAAFGADQHFNFEVAGTPELAKTLRARNGLRYNEAEYKKYAKADWKEGEGSILIVQHHGMIARPKTLDIRLISSAGSRKNGHMVSVGNLIFWAEGPGSEIINTFSGVTLPSKVISDMFGHGIAVMGFAMPVHEKDEAVTSSAHIRVSSADDESEVANKVLTKVSDIDAYARATLKDEQAALFVKTFVRTIGKQIVAAKAAKLVEEKEGAGWGFMAKLVGSAIATATEVADVRSWWLLPNHISASLIDVKAGDYELELDYEGVTLDLGSVRVPAGRVLVIPVRTLKPTALPVAENTVGESTTVITTTTTTTTTIQ